MAGNGRKRQVEVGRAWWWMEMVFRGWKCQVDGESGRYRIEVAGTTWKWQVRVDDKSDGIGRQRMEGYLTVMFLNFFPIS